MTATLPLTPSVKQVAKSRGFTGEEDEEVELPDVADRRITGKEWPLVPLLTKDKNIFSSHGFTN